MKTAFTFLTLLASTSAVSPPRAFVAPSQQMAVASPLDAMLDLRGGAMGVDESLALKATTFAAGSYGEIRAG